MKEKNTFSFRLICTLILSLAVALVLWIFVHYTDSLAEPTASMILHLFA